MTGKRERVSEEAVYATVRRTAAALEAAGADPVLICDAMIGTAVNAAARSAGPAATAAALREMADMIEAKARRRRERAH